MNRTSAAILAWAQVMGCTYSAECPPSIEPVSQDSFTVVIIIFVLVSAAVCRVICDAPDARHGPLRPLFDRPDYAIVLKMASLLLNDAVQTRKAPVHVLDAAAWLLASCYSPRDHVIEHTATDYAITRYHVQGAYHRMRVVHRYYREHGLDRPSARRWLEGVAATDHGRPGGGAEED